MGYGGYHPFPKRFGGGRPLLKTVHDSLNAGMGTAVDASNPTTIAWAENMAYARAIVFDGYGVNYKMSYQTDPNRLTDMLPRWEAILKENPSPTATDYDRRQAVKARMERFLSASSTHSRINSILKLALPNEFVAIQYVGVSNAVVHAPSEDYPWGSVVAGFDWYSTVSHILVFLQKPSGYLEKDFYNAAAKVVPLLDGVIPSTCTVDWYRAPASGAPIDVSDGPQQAGFYLDDEHNLDNNVFDDGEIDPAVLELTAWLRGRNYGVT